jgi:hypothetical protein
MVLPGDEAQVDARFCPFADSAILIGAQFALSVPQAQKTLWTYPIEHLGDLGLVESHFSPFGESLSIGAR